MIALCDVTREIAKRSRKDGRRFENNYRRLLYDKATDFEKVSWKSCDLASGRLIRSARRIVKRWLMKDVAFALFVCDRVNLFLTFKML